MPPAEATSPEVVLRPEGVKALDARLDRARLLDLTMETAGRAVADHLTQHFPSGRVLLLAGGGANGGDALVAARHLLALEREVSLLALPSKHPLARLNKRRLAAVGGQPEALSPPACAAPWAERRWWSTACSAPDFSRRCAPRWPNSWR